MKASSADSGTRMGRFWEKGLGGWWGGGLRLMHDLCEHRRPHAAAFGIQFRG